MLCTVYLGPCGATLWVRDHPDVVRPDLHVVDLLGDLLEALGKDEAT